MLKTFFIYLLFPCVVFAAQFTGTGFGETQDEARLNALSDLSAQLLVQVRSEISVSENISGEKEGQRNVSALSDVPLLGAQVSYAADTKQYEVKAVLDTEKSLPMYEKMLKELALQIRTALAQTDGKTGQSAIETLEKTYAQADTYEKAYAVAQLLGSTLAKDTDFSSAAVSERLTSLQKTATNLEDAVYILTKNVFQRNIYVLPPSAPSSSEVTQFAEAVQAVVEGGVNSVEKPSEAEYRMSGEYAVQGKSILLTYRLIRIEDGTAVTARTVRLAPAAFAGLDYIPKTADFDKLLKNGIAVSKDFRVDISTNKGNINLLFKNAQTVEILVKTSAPAYIYAVGHTLKKN
ncbi:hypothetical protein [Seleniivibrio sp.]|uniref:hypothetical protein n=1 Tax=Seleniivibrio sp. TaxID=2898801 RepID=UPI0025FB0672|nr:hypothetical protein [Seleniivibrio sp.]MCD8552530.1 LPP20 family lipoprotein [Seleniivibrio sp.]